jgi:predicted permease
MSTHPSSGPSRFWIALLRAALLFHPPRHRADYGSEIEKVFGARVTDARKTLRRWGLIAFQVREMRGLIRSGLSTRWEELTGRSSSPRQRNDDPSVLDGYGILSGVLSDLRFALRGLRKAPAFTASAVIVLALGIGATVTAFAGFKVAVLTPPPFPEADRLVSVDLTRSRDDGERISRWAYPYFQRFVDWPDRLIDPVAAYRRQVVTLTGLGPASQLDIEVVSPDYFRVVGLPLALGRGFVQEEGDPTGPYRVAVVSHAFWQLRLGGEFDAVGREIRLNGQAFQVVGIAPTGFSGFAGGADLWLPHGAYAVVQPGVLEQAGNHVAWVVGRLRPGVTLGAAGGQIEVVGQAIAEEWPRQDSYGAGLRSFSEVWTNSGAETASVLLAMAAGLVLLVACANLASLLFTRARRRVREGAVRRALGASRWRIVRGLLLESFTVAAVGGIAGVVLSLWGMQMIARAWPTQFLEGSGTGMQVINPSGLGLDAGVIAFAVLLSLGVALLIGIVPALRLSSFNITDHLKDGAGATRRRGGKAGIDPQGLLVGAQVALALILLVGVGLMGATVGRLLGVSEGFRTEQLLSFDFSSPQTVPRMDPRDPDVWRAHITLSAQFDERVQQRLTALPGVESVTMSSGGVLSGFQAVLGIRVEDATRSRDATSIGVVPVADNYFEMLGIPVVRGRGFDQSDGLPGTPVAVLSQSAVSMFFPDEDPIGKRIDTFFSLPGRQSAEVVGVVGDVMYTGPDQERFPVAYYSLRERRFGSTALVRTADNPTDVVRSIQQELSAMDPTVAMSNVTTLDQLITQSVGDRGLIFWLLLIFATITVLLAAVGTWGVVAYSVAQRQRELGLRIALGAGGQRVLRLVIKRSTLTALVGVVIGLSGAWAGSRILEAFLWETSARDPRIFLGGGVLLLAVVLLASYLPARRATRVDPVEVLRTVE